MGSDDTETMYEDDLELDDEDSGEVDFADLESDEEAKERQQAQGKVAQKFEREKKAAAQREAALMGSLKEAWGADALKQYPLADVNSIGLTGIDAAAKEKFLAEVQAQHEAREHALAEAGYVRLDGEGKPIERPEPVDGGKPTPTVGSNVEAERMAAQSWGKPLSGTDVQPNERARAEQELMESMQGGPKAVIDLMFKKNPGLTKWMSRKS